MQRSSTTATGAVVKKGVAIDELRLDLQRASSAQANLQSHPCYQSSLFNDKERAAGSLKAWKERHLVSKSTVFNDAAVSSSAGLTKNLNKDYQLENTIWSQSVKTARRLTLNNTQNISDWEIVLLKRQKSYAIAALGELKGKVSHFISSSSFFIVYKKEQQLHREMNRSQKSIN